MYSSLVGLAALSLVQAASAAPFEPQGGAGLNTTPVYNASSDFDFQSLNLALNQEWLELNLFNEALSRFNSSDLQAAGLSDADQALISYMAGQEVGHVDLLTSILGPNASQACNYSFPFETVHDFVDLSMKVTRVGESGVFGFLEHLDSRAAGALLGQAIATESRQQMIFRQFEGLFPMPYWFIPGITQSMAWSLQSQYITSCPASNPHIEWQNFPALNVTNQANYTAENGSVTSPAISTFGSAFTSSGTSLNLTWDAPGKQVGPDMNYTTSTNASEPQFVAWISQLNVTYTPLTNVSGNTGLTTQPGGFIYGNNTAPTINGTIFLLLTDSNVTVTPFNLSQIDAHVVAGPALYVVG